VEKVTELIKQNAQALNKEADRVSKYIKSVNKELRSAGVGLEVWNQTAGGIVEERYARLTSEEIVDSQSGNCVTVSRGKGIIIGYAKVEGRWEIALQRVDFGTDDDCLVSYKGDTFSLEKAPRYLRIKATPCIEPLLELLTKELSRKTEGLKSIQSS
jgi:hypothetical protein